jgi:hypothetical protein
VVDVFVKGYLIFRWEHKFLVNYALIILIIVMFVIIKHFVLLVIMDIMLRLREQGLIFVRFVNHPVCNVMELQVIVRIAQQVDN